MTNSTTAGARVHISAEYLSEDEPLELLRFHYVKSSCNRIIARGEGGHMRIPTVNEIKSQTDQAHGSRLAKPCSFKRDVQILPDFAMSTITANDKRSPEFYLSNNKELAERSRLNSEY
jgi:hypothetical protein